MGALVAGLGMGIAGSLFGKPKTQNQTTTSTTTLSPWEQQYWNTMTSKAQQIANTPYQAYTGNRVAPLSPEQNAGIQNTANNINDWRTPYNAASNAYSSAIKPMTGADVNQYMSPYVGDVISNIERIGNENFNSPGGVADQIRGDFTGLGQFGSRRMGDVMARAGQLNDEDTQGAVSNALETGYNNAEQEYNADKTRQLWGAGGLSSLAGQNEALTQGASNALLGVGGVEQQQAQNELNVPYENYVAAQQWPMETLQAAREGAPPNVGTTSNTTPVPVPNAIQNYLVGVGMYNMGMFDNMLPTSPTSDFGSYGMAGMGNNDLMDYAMNPSLIGGMGPSMPTNYGDYKRGGKVGRRYAKGGALRYASGGIYEPKLTMPKVTMSSPSMPSGSPRFLQNMRLGVRPYGLGYYPMDLAIGMGQETPPQGQGYAKGGHVLDYDGDDDNNVDVLRGKKYAKGGWIAGAIKHPGALHRMMHVPQGQKIPAKRLHAAANAGGELGRRARFAEELESFHHAKGGPIGYASGGHFIARAIKHPGALHRELHVPLGKKIPAKKLERAAHAGGKLGKRARFAEELKGFHHAKGGAIRGGLSALAA